MGRQLTPIPEEDEENICLDQSPTFQSTSGINDSLDDAHMPHASGKNTSFLSSVSNCSHCGELLLNASKCNCMLIKPDNEFPKCREIFMKNPNGLGNWEKLTHLINQICKSKFGY